MWREYKGDDPLAFELSLNLHRRHLNESQRAMVAAKVATLPRGTNQHASIEAPSQSKAAELLNVSRSAVQRAAVVRDDGAPELVEAVQRGLVSVSATADVATLAPAEQREVVARGEREIRRPTEDGRVHRRVGHDGVHVEALLGRLIVGWRRALNGGRSGAVRGALEALPRYLRRPVWDVLGLARPLTAGPWPQNMGAGRPNQRIYEALLVTSMGHRSWPSRRSWSSGPGR